MVTLNNNINAQNIVDRFADYVPVAANASIVYANDNLPFPEFPGGTYFEGTRTGRPIGISAPDNQFRGTTIIALTIYNATLGETNAYTRIRNGRFILNVTGGGGNNGSRPSPGIVQDKTGKAYFKSYYQAYGNTDHGNVPNLQPGNWPVNTTQASLTVDKGNVLAGKVISRNALSLLFFNLQTAWDQAKTWVQTVQVNVCHASCHSSCHSSRIRR